jgi:radical SAM-linked protein
MSADRFRYRIEFRKTEVMRFTGNLDLHRAWERTFRRANLPLAYSQGFNPRPRINLANALPLGLTSSAELLDVWFQEELDLAEISRALSIALPAGIEICSLHAVEPSEPALQKQVIAAEYTCALGLIDSPTALERAVEALMSSPTLPRTRRGKAYDLRPLIRHLWVTQGEDGEVSLRMRLSLREGATGRADEVLLALGLDPTQKRIQRSGLLFDEPERSRPESPQEQPPDR